MSKELGGIVDDLISVLAAAFRHWRPEDKRQNNHCMAEAS